MNPSGHIVPIERILQHDRKIREHENRNPRIQQANPRIGGLILGQGKIVTDGRVLRAMAKAGHFIYPVDNANQPYVDEENRPKVFNWKGQRYKITYFSGSFFPFVVLDNPENTNPRHRSKIFSERPGSFHKLWSGAMHDASTRRLIQSHEDFHFKPPKKLKKLSLPIKRGDKMFMIGRVPQINYLSSKEGRMQEYFHKFPQSTTVVMYAPVNRKYLLIVRQDGKAFNITDWFYK